MYARNSKYQSSFIALITVTLLSMSLLIIVIAVSLSGFSSRTIVLESELKEESRYLAESCVQTAILKYFQDNTYKGDNDWIKVGNKDCLIYSVVRENNNLIIRTSASSSKAFTHLLITADTNMPDYKIEKWEEVISHH